MWTCRLIDFAQHEAERHQIVNKGLTSIRRCLRREIRGDASASRGVLFNASGGVAASLRERRHAVFGQFVRPLEAVPAHLSRRILNAKASHLSGVPRGAFVPVLLGAVVLTVLSPGVGRVLKVGQRH